MMGREYNTTEIVIIFDNLVLWEPMAQHRDESEDADVQ